MINRLFDLLNRNKGKEQENDVFIKSENENVNNPDNTDKKKKILQIAGITVGTVGVVLIGLTGFAYLIGGSSNNQPIKPINVGNANNPKIKGTFCYDNRSEHQNTCVQKTQQQPNNPVAQMPQPLNTAQPQSQSNNQAPINQNTKPENKEMQQFGKIDIDKLFKDYAQKAKEEKSDNNKVSGAKVIPLAPPPNLPVGNLPVGMPTPAPNPFANNNNIPMKQQEILQPILIYGIACEDNICEAITNKGVIRQGDKIGDNEIVLSIDKKGIKTDKRYIPF